MGNRGADKGAGVVGCIKDYRRALTGGLTTRHRVFTITGKCDEGWGSELQIEMGNHSKGIKKGYG